MSDTVLSTLSEGVLTLVLNREAKLNAFNDEMHLALRAGIQRAHDDKEIRAVLLTGGACSTITAGCTTRKISCTAITRMPSSAQTTIPSPSRLLAAR